MNEDKKADRYQWLLLQYDSVYDPDWAYALEFQWVSCSGTVVEEFLVRYVVRLITAHAMRMSAFCYTVSQVRCWFICKAFYVKYT